MVANIYNRVCTSSISLAAFASPVFCTSLNRNEASFESNIEGESNSMIFPPSSTSIRSESITVSSRWAMVRTVDPLNLSRIVF